MFEFEVIQELEPNKEILEIIKNDDYTVENSKIKHLNELIKQNFYADGIINCPYIENENIVDNLTLIPKIPPEFL